LLLTIYFYWYNGKYIALIRVVNLFLCLSAFFPLYQ